MRPTEARRHQIRVVEIRQRRVRMGGSGVQHGLRQRLELRQVRARWGRWERVVDQTDGVTVIALQSPADVA